MEINKSITLDLSDSNSLQCVSAVEGDQQTRKITATIYDAGVKKTVPAEQLVKFRAAKPDGCGVIIPATVNPDGTVSVVLSQQCLAVPGAVKADFSFYNTEGDRILSTASFAIIVRPSSTGKNLASSNEFQELVDAIKNVHNYENNAKKSADDAKEYATAAGEHATEAKNEADRAKQQADNVDHRLGGLSFEIDPSDGGLNIKTTEA